MIISDSNDDTTSDNNDLDNENNKNNNDNNKWQCWCEGGEEEPWLNFVVLLKCYLLA